MADCAARPARQVVVLAPSLHDRVLFSQAQGILVGLTGCTPDRAAHALIAAAADLGLAVGEVGRRLMRCMTVDDDQAGPLMARLAEAALSSEPEFASESVPDNVIHLDDSPQGSSTRRGLPARKPAMSSATSPKKSR
jgi:hypothetical protein